MYSARRNIFKTASGCQRIFDMVIQLRKQIRYDLIASSICQLIIQILMKYGVHLPLLFRIYVLLSLTHCLEGQISCSSNCTAGNANAFCAAQGYCTCVIGYIFNCTTSASYAPQSSYLTPLTSAKPYYYILNSETGKELEYTVTFADSTNPHILETYQPDFYTDEGMNTPLSKTYTIASFNNQPGVFTCTFKITLSNQPDTVEPERLVLMVNISSPHIVPSLQFAYSYTIHESSPNLFLILGYVAGGLLVATSILFIMLIYRKKRSNRRSNKKQQPTKFDISHFAECMPETTISPQDRKNMFSCSVCLQEFDFNSTVRVTVCEHVFHTDCLDEWCVKNVSCPMCRTDLTKQNISKLKAEKERKSIQNEWIINSLAEEDEPSQIENPLNDTLIRNEHL